MEAVYFLHQTAAPVAFYGTADFLASYKTDTGWLFGRTGQYIQYGQAVDNRSAMAVYELVFPVFAQPLLFV